MTFSQFQGQTVYNMYKTKEMEILHSLVYDITYNGKDNVKRVKLREFVFSTQQQLEIRLISVF